MSCCTCSSWIMPSCWPSLCFKSSRVLVKLPTTDYLSFTHNWASSSDLLSSSQTRFSWSCSNWHLSMCDSAWTFYWASCSSNLWQLSYFALSSVTKSWLSLLFYSCSLLLRSILISTCWISSPNFSRRCSFSCELNVNNSLARSASLHLSSSFSIDVWSSLCWTLSFALACSSCVNLCYCNLSLS